MVKHPHHYMILGILFGLCSIGIAIALKISAQTTNTTVIACEYQLSSWSECNADGTQTRQIISRSPDGCYDYSIPPLKQTCTYHPSESTIPCSYTYSPWSTCSTTGYQTRTVISKSPEGCDSSIAPVLTQHCAYIKNAEESVSCSYKLSDWSICNSSGKQTRTIISRTPSGCHDTTPPDLSRSCEFKNFQSGGTDTASTTSYDSNGVIPAFYFLNLSDGDIIRDYFNIEGAVSEAKSVEYYLIPVDSNTAKYIGSAKNVRENHWEYLFDSKLQPNGSFFLQAKIKNDYGTYESERKMIIILNPTDGPVEKNDSFPDSTNSEWQKKYFGSENCIDPNICGGSADPDKDGLNNNEESRFGTSPKNSDTDRDGFLDGDEVKNGFNPLLSSPGDKSDRMVYESPKEKGDIKKDIYKIESVEMVKDEETRKIRIAGKGLPDSFINIYIYSDPIILTVKTDDEGNWSYILDKDLEDGNHQVYVAVTDNTGRITAKSESIAFVKTAEAVSVIPSAEASAQDRAISPTKAWFQKDAFFFIAIALGSLALALGAIGLIKHHLHKKTLQENIL